MRELISWFEDEYIYNFMIDLQGFITLKYSRGSLLEDSMIAWLYKLFAGDNEMILKLEAWLIVGHDTPRRIRSAGWVRVNFHLGRIVLGDHCLGAVNDTFGHFLSLATCAKFHGGSRKDD